MPVVQATTAYPFGTDANNWEIRLV
jgi:hypothetical protein